MTPGGDDRRESGPCAQDIGRRAFLGVLGLAATRALVACVYKGHGPLPPAAGATPVGGLSPTKNEVPALGPIPRAVPGVPRLISELDPVTNQIALTIDDGICATCVKHYVEFAEQSGIALTFSPNGRVRENWDRHAAALRQLLAAGRVQIANHTWSHANLLHRSDNEIRDDVKRNDSWIQNTFGVTSRPWFRPPYGERSPRTDDAVAALGYTNILMWNGTFGDSGNITSTKLRELAARYLKPGTIMLGHANVSTIGGMFDEIVAMIEERGLEPVLMSKASLPTRIGTHGSTTTSTAKSRVLQR